MRGPAFRSFNKDEDNGNPDSLRSFRRLAFAAGRWIRTGRFDLFRVRRCRFPGRSADRFLGLNLRFFGTADDSEARRQGDQESWSQKTLHRVSLPRGKK